MSLTIQDNSSGHAEEQNHKCLECVLGKKKKKSITDFSWFFIWQQLSMVFEETGFGTGASLCGEDSEKQMSCTLPNGSALASQITTAGTC